MSRTYRLRGTCTYKSTKWVDANVTLYNASWRLEVSNFLAHELYELPCQVIGKPLAYVEKEVNGLWSWVMSVSHVRCLSKYIGSDIASLMMQQFQAVWPSKHVSSKSWHPWARPVRYRQYNKQFMNRQLRRKSKLKLIGSMRRDELDSF